VVASIVNKGNLSTAPNGQSYQIPSGLEVQKESDDLVKRVAHHRKQGQQIVVVQGLGFVGSAVAAVIADAKDSSGKPIYFVIGIDLPTPSSYWKVARLNEGIPPIVSTDAELDRLVYQATKEGQNLYATSSEIAYTLADVIVVDVHLDVCNRLVLSPDDIQINLKSFEAAISTIGRSMRHDTLVLVETTVPVGTCEKIVLPILREERRLRGIDAPLYLAHAYERVMPGPNYVRSIRHFWRTFAGIDEASTVKARKFLSSFIDTEAYPLWELEDTSSSELAKLLENSYRASNIAFIHEWTLLAEKIGIDLFAVLESIRVRKGTHDNVRFPGFGVGGYCLTKDSLLAQWSATHMFGSDVLLETTLKALETNYQMPLHSLDLLRELIGDNLQDKKVSILGVSYLPDIADTRNSPTELLVDELMKAGANVVVHDPCVETWIERPDISINHDLDKCLHQADGIIFAVPHKVYTALPVDSFFTGKTLPAIIDAQNIISNDKADALHRLGCRLLGVGKGHWRKRGYQCQN
jgi:UDP-N-acetyl-D-glucosamine dehydrogenase